MYRLGAGTDWGARCGASPFSDADLILEAGRQTWKLIGVMKKKCHDERDSQVVSGGRLSRDDI